MNDGSAPAVFLAVVSQPDTHTGKASDPGGGCSDSAACNHGTANGTCRGKAGTNEDETDRTAANFLSFLHCYFFHENAPNQLTIPGKCRIKVIAVLELPNGNVRIVMGAIRTAHSESS